MNFDNITIKELLERREHSHPLTTKSTIARARQRELYEEEERKELEENYEVWYSPREL